ncbi:GntR family transcriptional regulator [Streptomyces sp. NPDC090106]|uniref:GntR family transcriptional regulator n=1 Tax=Streptomyces sp. NPDC090106 TaxID=3365946 RepID=UPI0037F66700
MSAPRAGDGGKEFTRVAEELRARIANGTYPLNSVLPSQRELAELFDVSRDTIQRALGELTAEGLILTRQGSGSRVISTPLVQSQVPGPTKSAEGTTLGPLIDAVFEKQEVRLDVFTLTSESLDAYLHLQAERIRRRRIAPERIALRMLLPEDGASLPYPRVKDDADDLRPQRRLHDISRRHSESLQHLLVELRDLKLVPDVEVEIRRVRMVPAFKLYLFNDVEALLGMYNVMERTMTLDDGEAVQALDVIGLSARLTHHVKDDDPYSPGSLFVANMKSWYDSVWDLLAN